MKTIKIKKTLQPVQIGNMIHFGLGQEGLERTIDSSQENIHLLKYLNEELDRKFLNLSEQELSKKVFLLQEKGLLTTNDYSETEQYSRNINFFEWIDTSSNVNPQKYQEKLANSCVLIVGLGGIGANVCEILVRMGLKSFIIVDFDQVEASNLTRQGTYFFNDIGKNKVDVVEDYIKKIDPAISVNKINTRIEKKDDLRKIFIAYDFDLSICCADYPKYLIDKWFDELSFEFNRPFVSGSYASTVINTFCINPGKTITSSQLYGEYGTSTDQLLKNLKVPTSVIAPITYMAAGLVSYQAQSVLTGLNYKTEAVQIDIFNWKAYQYDITKK